MNATGSYSSVGIEDSIARIRAVIVGFPLPLRSLHLDIQYHPTTLTETSPNSTGL